MTTYTERRGMAPFDWNRYLHRAINLEACSMAHRMAESYASDWVTCACGNACESIPRDHTGAPIDPELMSLGLGFYSAISLGHYENAKEILKRIEKRSAEIIAEMGKEVDNV